MQRSPLVTRGLLKPVKREGRSIGEADVERLLILENIILVTGGRGGEGREREGCQPVPKERCLGEGEEH